MTDIVAAHAPSRAVAGARWALAGVALLFVLGALGQFFLVGLSVFEDAARWDDHANLGHAIGLLTWVLWIPAVLGRAGRGLVIATLALFVLFEAQYGFISAGNGVAKALHPLNGAVLLVLGGWICQRAIALLREPDLTREATS
jgi:hypothetical protein